MEAQRIRTIINLYAELKASEEQFKNIEPCFVEGNEYLAKLWTTQGQDAGGGVENAYDIEIPIITPTIKDEGKSEGDESKDSKTGSDGVAPSSKDISEGNESEGSGDDGGDGEGDSEKQGEGKGKGKGKGKSKDKKDSDGSGEGDGEGEGDDEGDGDKEGEGKGKGKSKDKKDSDSSGEGDGEGEGDDEADGDKEGEGKGKGKSKDKKGEGEQHEGDDGSEEEDDSEGKSSSQQQPQPEQPEFEQDESENPLDYKMRFPLITEMIYGVKVCNSSDDEQTKSIEKRLIVGIGIAICRSIMAESGTLGESVLSAKKESYRGIFEILMLLFLERNKYDSDGNIIGINNSNSEELKELILADKFMNRILPMLTVFNKDLFNENQIDNAIDFCFASLNEKSTVIVSERYFEDINEINWGMLLLKAEDKNNYQVNYYRYSSKMQDGKFKKDFDKIDVVIVNKGKTDYSVNIDSIGDEFYKFIWALIFNYLNNNSQTIESQCFDYRKKKITILAGASNIFLDTISNIERLID